MKTYIIALLVIFTLIVGCSGTENIEPETLNEQTEEVTEPQIEIESGSDISEEEFITDEETDIGEII